MEAGLMKKVRSVNRSSTPDSYFSLRKPFIGGGVCGKMSRGNVLIPQQGGADFLFCPRRRIPSYATDTLLHSYCAFSDPLGTGPEPSMDYPPWTILWKPLWSDAALVISWLSRDVLEVSRLRLRRQNE